MSLNKENITGTLYIIATPLGNEQDLSPRARNILETVPIILAEDTKRASLNFSRWNLKFQKFISFNEHSEEKKLEYALEFLTTGQNMALISDAGMPILSDPGYLIVKACREKNIKVTVIPGPSAPITALAGSGIAPQPFTFFGFLPRKTSDIEKTIAPFAKLSVSLVFFERKDRLQETLSYLYTLLGNREVCIARELTKEYEEYINFHLNTIPNLNSLLGEITVIIGPPIEFEQSTKEEVLALINKEKEFGGTIKNIAKRVQSQCHGWTTSEIYALATRD